MAETKTTQRQQTVGADMRDQGMPAGHAPAVRRPETAMERAARERQEGAKTLFAMIEEHREEIEAQLQAYDLTFERFLGAVRIGLAQGMANDDDFGTGRPAAFLSACLRAAHIGLMPDGKQGAVVRYNQGYSFIPMTEGFVEIIWKTGLVKAINHNVVCEGDQIEFAEGDAGYVTQVRSLTRPATAKVIGAWCVIEMTTGGKLIEIVDQVDLEKIAAISKAKKGPRQDWAREMHRKAPFRRIVKRMPKTERLSTLIEIDDSNVDLEKLNAPAEEPAIPRRQLMANRAAKRRSEPKAPKGPDGLPVHDANEDLIAEGIDPEEAREESHAHAGEPVEGPAFILRAVIKPKERNDPRQYDNVDLWEGDIAQTMAAFSEREAELKGFWRLNHGFIEEAGRNGYGEAAMRLIAKATEMGVQING